MWYLLRFLIGLVRSIYRVALHLELPNVHNMFYISMLRKICATLLSNIHLYNIEHQCHRIEEPSVEKEEHKSG